MTLVLINCPLNGIANPAALIIPRTRHLAIIYAIGYLFLTYAIFMEIRERQIVWKKEKKETNVVEG